MNIQAAPI